MTDQPITNDSPGSALFPEFDTLYDLIANEVEGLTDDQLDWTSEEYGWAEWSIRVQLSHMASLIYRWLILRWGDVTFPNGEHGVEDVNGLAASPFDRRMDDTKYYELQDILTKLREGIDLARRVLAERNVGFLRSHTVTVTLDGGWGLMIQAHPTAVTPTEQANTSDDAVRGLHTPHLLRRDHPPVQHPAAQDEHRACRHCQTCREWVTGLSTTGMSARCSSSTPS